MQLIRTTLRVPSDVRFWLCGPAMTTRPHGTGMSEKVSARFCGVFWPQIGELLGTVWPIEAYIQASSECVSVRLSIKTIKITKLFAITHYCSYIQLSNTLFRGLYGLWRAKIRTKYTAYYRLKPNAVALWRSLDWIWKLSWSLRLLQL